MKKNLTKRIEAQSQWAHHVESTSIPRGYYVDTSNTKFDEFPHHFHVLFRCNLANRKIHVVSTYFFFGVISVAEKSTFFPRTFFGVISLVKTFTLFLCTFFGCNFDGRKIHVVFTYVFRYNLDDRKIRLAGMYFFRQNFDG